MLVEFLLNHLNHPVFDQLNSLTGNDVQTDPKCWVVVDKRIINTEFLTPMKAVLASFMCYFILKETYPKKIAALMEFLQRFVSFSNCLFRLKHELFHF